MAFQILEVRMWLTWRGRPANLDFHLSGPDGDGGRFHLDWRGIGSPPVPFVSLDVDQRNSFGPETIRVVPNPATDLFESGLPSAGQEPYVLWAHNYSRERQAGAAGWYASRARVGFGFVGVVDGVLPPVIRNQFHTEYVVQALGQTLAGIWRVADFTIVADGSGFVGFPKRRLVAGTSTTILEADI